MRTIRCASHTCLASCLALGQQKVPRAGIKHVSPSAPGGKEWIEMSDQRLLAFSDIHCDPLSGTRRVADAPPDDETPISILVCHPPAAWDQLRSFPP